MNHVTNNIGPAGATGATGAQGARGADGAPGDPLMYYRVGKLEEAYETMSAALAEMVITIKGGKWALALVFGIIQPIAIALLIYFLTNR